MQELDPDSEGAFSEEYLQFRAQHLASFGGVSNDVDTPGLPRTSSRPTKVFESLGRPATTTSESSLFLPLEQLLIEILFIGFCLTIAFLAYQFYRTSEARKGRKRVLTQLVRILQTFFAFDDDDDDNNDDEKEEKPAADMTSKTKFSANQRNVSFILSDVRFESAQRLLQDMILSSSTISKGQTFTHHTLHNNRNKSNPHHFNDEQKAVLKNILFNIINIHRLLHLYDKSPQRKHIDHHPRKHIDHHPLTAPSSTSSQHSTKTNEKKKTITGISFQQTQTQQQQRISKNKRMQSFRKKNKRMQSFNIQKLSKAIYQLEISLTSAKHVFWRKNINTIFIFTLEKCISKGIPLLKTFVQKSIIDRPWSIIRDRFTKSRSSPVLTSSRLSLKDKLDLCIEQGSVIENDVTMSKNPGMRLLSKNPGMRLLHDDDNTSGKNMSVDNASSSEDFTDALQALEERYFCHDSSSLAMEFLKSCQDDQNLRASKDIGTIESKDRRVIESKDRRAIESKDSGTIESKVTAESKGTTLIENNGSNINGMNTNGTQKNGTTATPNTRKENNDEHLTKSFRTPVRSKKPTQQQASKELPTPKSPIYEELYSTGKTFGLSDKEINHAMFAQYLGHRSRQSISAQTISVSPQVTSTNVNNIMQTFAAQQQREQRLAFIELIRELTVSRSKETNEYLKRLVEIQEEQRETNRLDKQKQKDSKRRDYEVHLLWSYGVLSLALSLAIATFLGTQKLTLASFLEGLGMAIFQGVQQVLFGTGHSDSVTTGSSDSATTVGGNGKKNNIRNYLWNNNHDRYDQKGYFMSSLFQYVISENPLLAPVYGVLRWTGILGVLWISLAIVRVFSSVLGMFWISCLGGALVAWIFREQFIQALLPFILLQIIVGHFIIERPSWIISSRTLTITLAFLQSPFLNHHIETDDGGAVMNKKFATLNLKPLFLYVIYPIVVLIIGPLVSGSILSCGTEECMTCMTKVAKIFT